MCITMLILSYEDDRKRLRLHKQQMMKGNLKRHKEGLKEDSTKSDAADQACFWQAICPFVERYW